jgi:hypothetical protein
VHPWVSKEFARLRDADLNREADRDRLVALARSAAGREVHRAGSCSESLHGLVHLVRLIFGGRTPHPKGH